MMMAQEFLRVQSHEWQAAQYGLNISFRLHQFPCSDFRIPDNPITLEWCPQRVRTIQHDPEMRAQSQMQITQR